MLWHQLVAQILIRPQRHPARWAVGRDGARCFNGPCLLRPCSDNKTELAAALPQPCRLNAQATGINEAAAEATTSMHPQARQCCPEAGSSRWQPRGINMGSPGFTPPRMKSLPRWHGGGGAGGKLSVPARQRSTRLRSPRLASAAAPSLVPPPAPSPAPGAGARAVAAGAPPAAAGAGAGAGMAGAAACAGKSAPAAACTTAAA
jgi:hypothetical protein